MNKLIKDRRQEALDDCPDRHRQRLQRAYAGNSLRAAVDAFCIHCVGYDIQAAKNCTAYACPLYEVKSYSPSSEDS